MVAMLAFGGTYAYFTSTGLNVNSSNTKLARINLIAEDTFTAQLKDNYLPKESLFSGNLSIDDDSNRASYIFVEFSAMVYKWDAAASDYSTTGETLNNATLSTSTQVVPAEGTATNLQAVTGKPGVFYFVTTEDVYEGETLKTKGTVGQEFTISGLTAEIPATWDNTYQEAKIVITIKTNSCQYFGFETDVAGAYAAAISDNGEAPKA